jgi:hypothetical protein
MRLARAPELHLVAGDGPQNVMSQFNVVATLDPRGDEQVHPEHV